MTDIYEYIANYQAGKYSQKIYSFSTIFQWYGMLRLFNSVYPDHPHQDSLNKIDNIIYELPIDESDVTKYNKRLHDK